MEVSRNHDVPGNAPVRKLLIVVTSLTNFLANGGALICGPTAKLSPEYARFSQWPVLIIRRGRHGKRAVYCSAMLQVLTQTTAP